MGNKLKFSKIKKAILLPSLLFMLGRTNCPAVLSAEAQQPKTSVSTTAQAQNFVFTQKNLDEIKADTETIINLINKYNTSKCSDQELMEAFANFGPRLIANFNLLASDYEKLEKNNLKQFNLTSKEMTEIYNAKGQNTEYTRNLEVACVDIPHAMHLFSQTFGLIFTRAEYADILKIDENDQKNEWCLINAKEGKRDFSNETNAILNKVIQTIFEYARFYYWGTNTNYNLVKTNLTTMITDMNINQKTIQETANILKAINVKNTNMFGNSLLCDAIVAEIRLQGSLVVLADIMKQNGQDINKLISEALKESQKQQTRQINASAATVTNATTTTNSANLSDTVVPAEDKPKAEPKKKSLSGLTGLSLGGNFMIGNEGWNDEGKGVNSHMGIQLSGDWTTQTKYGSLLGGGLEFRYSRPIDKESSAYPCDNIQVLATGKIATPLWSKGYLNINGKVGVHNDEVKNWGLVGALEIGYKQVFNDDFSIDFGFELLGNTAQCMGDESRPNLGFKITANYYDKNHNIIWKFGVGYDYSNYKRVLGNTNIPSSTTPGGTTPTNGGTTPTNGGTTSTDSASTNRGKDLPTIPINMIDQTMWR